ncbi:branched-chain amino acid ABC transporter permease, partial [Streptomyces olivaceus]
MTTQTTAPGNTGAPAADDTTGLIGIPPRVGRALATGGGVLTVVSTFLAWTWTAEFPGDLTVYGYPGGLQVLVLVAGALTALIGLASYDVKGLRWLVPAGADAAVRFAALAAFLTAWYTVVAISAQLGGVVNLEPGGYVAAAATLIALLGSLALPVQRPEPDPFDPDDTGWEQFKHTSAHNWQVVKAAFASGSPRPLRPLPSYAEILVIVAVLAVGLFVFTYGIGTEYDELFVGFLITAGLGFAALNKSGLIAQVSEITARHQNITVCGAFVAAACFPFTQSDDQYATIGVYILIFATVALGLNIVVGLAGLLDLGYVAFLGVGAYAASMVSGSPSSPFDLHLPFWGAVLVGAAASLIFGV